MSELARFVTPAGEVVLRVAVAEDLPALVALLADDALGAAREDLGPPLPQGYRDAFAALDADPAHRLTVVQDASGGIVATMQLVLMPGLSRGGAWRLQIEAVRVAGAWRGGGLGTQMMRWAIADGAARGAAVVQLTSAATRHEAHRFYERLGFVASHTGMKLRLAPAAHPAGTVA